MQSSVQFVLPLETHISPLRKLQSFVITPALVPRLPTPAIPLSNSRRRELSRRTSYPLLVVGPVPGLMCPSRLTRPPSMTRNGLNDSHSSQGAGNAEGQLYEGPDKGRTILCVTDMRPHGALTAPVIERSWKACNDFPCSLSATRSLIKRIRGAEARYARPVRRIGPSCAV